MAGDFLCDRETKRIHVSKLCNSDQTAQCEDRTDISFCLCDKYKWLCKDQSKCIEPKDVCNKRGDNMEPSEHIDCDDESDEDSQMCSNVWTCTEGFILIEGKRGGARNICCKSSLIYQDMLYLLQYFYK